jgi:hypothetical protein
VEEFTTLLNQNSIQEEIKSRFFPHNNHVVLVEEVNVVRVILQGVYLYAVVCGMQ